MVETVDKCCNSLLAISMRIQHVSFQEVSEYYFLLVSHLGTGVPSIPRKIWLINRKHPSQDAISFCKKKAVPECREILETPHHTSAQAPPLPKQVRRQTNSRPALGQKASMSWALGAAQSRVHRRSPPLVNTTSETKSVHAVCLLSS